MFNEYMMLIDNKWYDRGDMRPRNFLDKIMNPYNYSPFVVWTSEPRSMYDTTTPFKKANGSAYTDRLWQWDNKKYDELCEKHFKNRGQYWDRRDPNEIQNFLRDYFDNKTISLIAVVEYCNVATGYPVWNLIWKYKKNLRGISSRSRKVKRTNDEVGS